MPNFTTTRTTCLVKFCCPHGCWARLTLESVSVVKFFVSADSCLRGHILIIICTSYPYKTVTLHCRFEYDLWPHMSIGVIWVEQVCTNGVYFVSKKLVSIVNFQNFIEVYMVQSISQTSVGYGYQCIICCFLLSLILLGTSLIVSIKRLLLLCILQKS